MNVEKFGHKYCEAHNQMCMDMAVLKNQVFELENFRNTVTTKLDEINRINDKITRIEVLMEKEFKLINEKFTINKDSKNRMYSSLIYPLIVATLGAILGAGLGVGTILLTR